jgi:hypothetical protein
MRARTAGTISAGENSREHYPFAREVPFVGEVPFVRELPWGCLCQILRNIPPWGRNKEMEVNMKIWSASVGNDLRGNC